LFSTSTPRGLQTGTGTYSNTDLARARGINLSGEFRLRRWLSVNGNYSHDDSRVLKSPNAFDPVQLPGIIFFAVRLTPAASSSTPAIAAGI